MLGQSQRNQHSVESQPFPYIDHDLQSALRYLTDQARKVIRSLDHMNREERLPALRQLDVAIRAIQICSDEIGTSEQATKLLDDYAAARSNLESHQPGRPSLPASGMTLESASIPSVIDLLRHLEAPRHVLERLQLARTLRRTRRQIRGSVECSSQQAALATLALVFSKPRGFTRARIMFLVWRRLTNLSSRRPDPGLSGVLANTWENDDHWHVCQYLEAYLRIRTDRNDSSRKIQSVLTEPLVQTCLGQITAWQVRREDDPQFGAFRNGDQGTVQTNATCAAVFTLTEFRRLARQLSTNRNARDRLDEIGKYPVPARTLVLQPPRTLRLLPGIEMDFSASIAGLFLTLLITFTTSICVWIAPQFLNLSKCKGILSFFIIIGIPIALFAIARIVRLRRPQRSRHTRFTIRLSNESHSQIADISATTDAMALSPTQAAVLMEALIQNGVTRGNELLADLAERTKRETFEIRHATDETQIVIFGGSFDLAVRLRSLIHYWTRADEETRSGLTPLIVSMAVHLVRRQLEDNRNGGWKINRSDSRASVTATSEAVLTLSTLRDSPDPDISLLRNALRGTTSDEPSEPVLNLCSAALASGVEYLRDDLSRKLDSGGSSADSGSAPDVDTYRLALPLLALSTRAIFRGKHGGDEPKIRAAMDLLSRRLLDASYPVVEDQLIARECTSGHLETSLHRHYSTSLAIRAILASEQSLDGSVLQSQIGPYGTDRRPFTSRVFQAPIEVGFTGLVNSAHQVTSRPNAWTPEHADRLASVLLAIGHADRHKWRVITAGQRWSEHCRRRVLKSDRALALWTWSAAKSKDGRTAFRTGFVSTTGGTRVATAGLLGSSFLIASTLSALQWNSPAWSARASLLLGLSVAIAPAAAVFQFASRPARFATSLAWATGAYVAVSISLLALLDFVLGTLSVP